MPECASNLHAGRWGTWQHDATKEMGKRCKLNEIQSQKRISKRCITFVFVWCAFSRAFRPWRLWGTGGGTPPAPRRRFTRGFDERTNSSTARAPHLINGPDNQNLLRSWVPHTRTSTHPKRTCICILNLADYCQMLHQIIARMLPKLDYNPIIRLCLTEQHSVDSMHR